MEKSHNNLKEYTIRRLKHELTFQEFLALKDVDLHVKPGESWGLIGTNRCRDLVFEDCIMSRFDAHTGVTNCTIRRCRLGWQCLNAIGFGTFLLEDTELCGQAVVHLREDYGCTWRGNFIIRNPQNH